MLAQIMSRSDEEKKAVYFLLCRVNINLYGTTRPCNRRDLLCNYVINTADEWKRPKY